MKNKNLLNWLWTDSHEKQSPQRFARYAVMLMMLLTLGVGQMWAYTAHFSLMGDPMDNSWAKDTKYMINTGTGTTDEWFIYAYVAKNQYFALNNGSNQYGPGTNGSTIKNGSGGGQGSYNTNSWKFTGTSGIIKICCAESNNREWYPYVWVEESAPTIKFKHPWNGGSWTEQTATKQSDGTYRFKGQYGGTAGFNAGYSSNFKYNSSATTVTGSPASGDYCYFIWNPVGYVRGTQDYDNGNTQSEHCGTFTIVKLCGLTYNGNGRTGGTAVPSALSDQKYGSSVTLSSAAMIKTGYTLTGWNTANDGSGTHYDLGASFTFSNKSNTLYAEWTQTITVDKNTGTSAGSMSICFNAGSLKSFTAATKTDWILDSYWTTADESGSKVIEYDASTGTASLVSSLSGYITTGKWTRTAATKLYAHWKQTYTVTYNANYPASATSTSGSVPTDATEYASGATVTVKSNSGSLAAGGYTFAGWQTEPTGGTSYDAGSGTFSITEPTTLYAKWTENKRNVTISAQTGGSVNITSASVGVATTTTVTATAYPGYRFTGWTATNCSVASTSSASTTLSGNGTAGSGTLVANFARTYAYLEGRMTVYNAARSTETHTASINGGWDENSTRIAMDYDETNHYFYRHTYKTPAELKAQISSQVQWFSIARSNASGSWSGKTTYHPSANTDLTTTGSANKKAAQTSTTKYNYKFNSSTSNGYAIIYFDEAGVWYELEHSLIYHANYAASGTSGTAPATEYYPNGFAATAAGKGDLTMTNYTFSGWNTDEHITGTSYAVGSSITMNANKDLYAVWIRSIPMDDQDATTGVSNTVYGTYNCTTLSEYTNPEKTGYTFNGWYTQVAGGGNYVISPEKELQPGVYHWTNYDNNTNEFMRYPTSTSSLYAKWTQTVTLNANLANHGSGDNTSATIVYKATDKSSITHCTPATGYHLVGYYTAATDGVKVLNADGSFASSAVTDYITDGKWTKAGATTLYAHYEPNTYDVILDVNGATSGSNQTVTATFDAAMPTVCSDGTTPLAAPSKTGYTFGGYWTNNTGTGTQYYTNALASNHIWDVATNNTHIYAKWTANPYTVQLDIDEDNHGTIASKTTSQSVTYDGATTTVPALPTAAQGYALDGYYTDQLGEGVKVINADGTWIASVTGYTDGSKRWVHADDVTLYAYYKKAEVTGITFSPAAIVATNATVTATPTISPTPTGTTAVCWELQYSNGTRVPSQPTFTSGGGNAVSFTAPSTSATYRLQAVLHLDDCNGDELSVYSETFQVAGEHTVTVRYQDSDGRTLKDTIHITARPLDWTTLGDITPPTITGYKFDHWDAGDGVTIKNGESTTTTTTTSSIQIKATYDGTLTAVYAKKRMIYFNNTLGWSSVYVYFYKNDSYWQTGSPYNGSGANTSYTWTNTPYSEGKHGQMLPVSEGSNIYYFDAEAAGVNASYDDVVFTEADQHGEGYFHDTKAVRRGDYKTSLPMFVPVDQTPSTHNKTDYYNKGYWMNYPENTGYTLKIYNAWNATKETAAVQSIAFPYSEDLKMPLKMDVELSDGYNHDYWFMVYRNDGTYMGSAYHFKQGYQDEQTITGGENKNKITTSAPGNYTFILTYHGDDSNPKNYNFYIDVDFPIASGDYRIYYSDNATWSKAAHTKDSWYHPSHSIGKATTEAKKDTISFFIPKGVGISHTMKFQKASVTNEGVVTWDDVDGGSITIPSSVNATGVYNFIVSQPAGGSSISLEKVEPYTGNFYIRTDCAGNTKWDSFKNVDHQMTYSDYAENNSGFSHYYAHWVESGVNVKFVIANDYSMCITDTLIEDYGTTIANISNIGALNSASANIRFMWNQSTNKVSRAYIGGSTNISDRFLVLEGDSKMYDKDGSALSISGLNPNEANLIDDQNFVYEREIQVNTKARAKLTAKYNSNIQYFKGSEGAFAEGTTIELLGGDAIGKHTMRIVYDFKTNRLVTAYVPSGTIDADIAINADLMIVREHQGAGQQLLFEGAGKLSKVHTVYGVMRFNRWTLNNKSTADGHSPVGDPKSIYERSLYWISFPFNVNLSDVFGFGTYGVDWIIEYYDGAERATNGYWIDSDGFWKMVMPAQRADFTLEAGKGYVLAIDIDAMKDNNETFWANNIEQVELFFPSATNVENITQTTAHTIVPEHECTIDRRTDKSVNNINKDRTKADSHWNMIGIPSYANYGATLTSDEEGTQTITWNSNPYTNDLPFLYEWNMTDDSYTVQSGTTYLFKAMHSYMVQYHGDLYWSLASATPTPSPIVARRAYAEKPQNAEFRLELQQNEKMVDQTFVNMKDAEEISAGFKFDEDLCKEFNAGKANIYTLIENYLPAAGNTLPMSDQTTLVPVGVKTTAAGEYTFAMPDGTNGASVVLIDNIAGTRTNLALSDYTVSLGKGDLSDRFMLEIAPVKQMPTDIENVQGGDVQGTKVRKVMVDGILYIVKDGKVFDAHGSRVK